MRSLTLAGLTNYQVRTNASTAFQASGAGSELSLPKLASIDMTSASIQVQALAGGSRPSCPCLAQISGGPALLESDGTGSELNISDLASLAPPGRAGVSSTVRATNGGTVTGFGLTTLDHINLTLDGTGTIATAQITSFTNAALLLSGGTVNLPVLADADGSSFEISGGATLTPAGHH